jgi:signal transduction histidine kinase/ActR/RegA family two-component response regulator
MLNAGYTVAMERLVAVVQELSLASDLPSIQGIVRRAARELAGADGATFVLRDGDLCHYADEDAISPLWKGQRFPMHTCISGWAMLNRAPAMIEDIYRDDRIPHDAYRPTFVKSLAMVPIRTADPIGAIGVYWARVHRPGAEELRLIQALADTTAVAMENVSIREHLEQRVRDRTVEAVAARDEAQRANALKTRFLSAANHDLRQPLQALGSYLSAAAQATADAAVHDACDKARGSVRTMGDLLDALLDLDRLQSGAVKPVLADFPLRELARRIAAAHEPQAQARGLTLSVTGEDCTVRSDPALLARVLDNLIGNAVRYTPRGTITIRCAGSGGRAVVDVIDTGIGIPEHAQERIFDEWYQVDNAARDRARGLGLGLSIVKYLARVLDHRIHVSSRPDAGSTFSLELPLGEHGARAADVAAPRAAAPGGAQPIVLIVEDDAAIADSTLLVLKLSGIEARHVAEPEAALEQIRAGFVPNILLTDYFLPRGNGGDTVSSVRRALGADIPAVILTGDMSLQDGDVSGLGNCTLLHKPVDGDRLVGVMQSLVRARPLR